jgi:XTP/dITP diphosphohydrolase
MTFRLKPGDSLVAATHNEGKLRELRDLFQPFGITVQSAAELGVPEPEETGETFEDNARLKAVITAFATNRSALSDDSGLAVDALGGDPGVHSARWAGEPRDFHRAMARLEDALASKGATTKPARNAQFVCVLCLANPMGAVQFFRGTVDGHLVWPPRGAKGFGYDPMFVPEGRDVTFGEMDPAEKHDISHRAKAFAAFRAAVLAGDGDAG